ncbi:Hypothetical_protein [Hexamita inflata]|nr:Hypothetical protein HINF_LOCUS35818 [Hexamita inflata]
MMLPDQIYSNLFNQVQIQLNLPMKVLQQQFWDLANQYVYNFQCSQTQLSLNQSQDCYNRTTKRKQSVSDIEFEQVFVSKIQQIFTEENINIEANNNYELCQEIANYLQKHQNSQITFWNKLSQKIQNKTSVQLREYYKKSFSKFLYTQCITNEDKQVLKQLILQMPDSKPSEIASHFMSVTSERNYFKRNIIMYVVNRKNLLTKLQHE